MIFLEYRCSRCGRLLCKKSGKTDTVEIKCPKCGAMNEIK